MNSIDTKVAIIGGGLAGLRAALELRLAGIEVDLFEARNRLGGRTHSLSIDGKVLELGGASIDEFNSEIIALAKRYGLTLHENYPAGSVAMPIRFALQGGPYSQREFNRDAQPLVQALKRDAQSIEELFSLPAVEYLDRLSLTPAFREALDVLWDGEFGSGLAESSAATFFELALEDLTPDQDGLFEPGYVKYSLPQGMGALVSGMAEESAAAMRLDHVLKRISSTEQGVELIFDTPEGEFAARYSRTVVALPVAVLRTLELTGLGLPEDLLALVQEIPFGNNEKVILASSKPFARPEEAVFDSTMRGLLWSKTVEDGCIITILHRTPDLADRPDFIDRLRFILPELAQAELRVLMETDWVGSQFSLGSYSCFGGAPTVRAALKRYRTEAPANRFGNLILAGEYLSPDYRVQSHMEGALLSGKRAAQAILGPRTSGPQ